ncbi:hypothetical protein COLO4_24800 [Corchorus olitorius]|uniref:Uncharacterized protein n=1 Tax=Corchorus olitorius TaxID=93759 RepID=A0A1R3I6U8_9ROSI|nr:hypothetical protein COLO4_24800 [Corchorus olitorius]
MAFSVALVDVVREAAEEVLLGPSIMSVSKAGFQVSVVAPEAMDCPAAKFL